MRAQALQRALDALPSDECVLWDGALDKDGYGKTTLMVNGKRQDWRAHRLVWFCLHGEVPPVLDHTCEVKACVNDAHLDPDVDSRENTIRTMERRHAGIRDVCAAGHPRPIGTKCRPCNAASQRRRRERMAK